MNAIPTGLVVWVMMVFLTVAGCATTGGVPSAVVRDAPRVGLPGVTRPEPGSPGEFDCNNAVHWSGETIYAFSSVGHPYRGEGPDLFHMKRPSTRVKFDNEAGWKMGSRWIEATYKDADGRLYMWYHNEPPGICPEVKPPRLTAPRIGQMVSMDDGLHWRDQGIVLEAPADSLHCATANDYFAGGNGDFCVNLDNRKEYFYFFISTYHKDVAEQGVAVARMRYADRDDPVGKVLKWREGGWTEPGLGGHVTPILPVAIDWHRADADAFWGPSVHWNTHVRQWVMLLNRAIDKSWKQEGIYVSFNPDIANPKGWSTPVKIIDAAALENSRWYPQVIGIQKGQTDKLAGRVARLFVTGISKWELVFLRPGEKVQAEMSLWGNP